MFNTLILPHLPKIRAWVAQYAERVAEHDDIFQEVLIEIFQNIEQAAAADHLQAWLHTLTRRKVGILNTRHRRDHHYWAEPPTAHFYEDLPDRPTVSLEAPSSRSDHTLPLEDTLLQRALDTLTPMEREIILARSEGERQADIAARLGLHRRLISYYEHSARETLKAYLRPALARQNRKARIPQHKRKS